MQKLKLSGRIFKISHILCLKELRHGTTAFIKKTCYFYNPLKISGKLGQEFANLKSCNFTKLVSYKIAYFLP